MDAGGNVNLENHLAAYLVPPEVIADAKNRGWVDASHWVASIEKSTLAAYHLGTTSAYGPDDTVNSDKDAQETASRAAGWRAPASRVSHHPSGLPLTD